MTSHPLPTPVLQRLSHVPTSPQEAKQREAKERAAKAKSERERIQADRASLPIYPFRWGWGCVHSQSFQYAPGTAWGVALEPCRECIAAFVLAVRWWPQKQADSMFPNMLEMLLYVPLHLSSVQGRAAEGGGGAPDCDHRGRDGRWWVFVGI